MKPFTHLGLILLFVLINTCFAESKEQGVEPKRQGVGSKWEVVIYNYQTNSSLWIHCKSKDDDLNEHKLEMKGKYSWNFKENFWQTTLFWCNFSSWNGHASFEVFWPEKREWLSARCAYYSCRWVATNDGFFLVNIPDRKLELLHHWKPL